MLWVPPGLAHGILVTSEYADFLYKCTDFYAPEHERTLAWNDPAIAVPWPLPAGVAAQALGQGQGRRESRGDREISVRVLVLGGRGQIASAVAAAAPERHEVVLRSRGEVDIGDAAAIERAVRESQAGWIVNGAAYTAVDLAEDEPAKATAVNDIAVGALAAAAQRSGARLLHLSTDFVFDGASSRAYLPDDAPRPLGVYGATKLAGERRVLDSGGNGIVLRTAWVRASRGRNFVLTMLRLMREKDRLAVVCDQIGAPTWAGGIAAAIWGMIDADVRGGHPSLDGPRGRELRMISLSPSRKRPWRAGCSSAPCPSPRSRPPTIRRARGVPGSACSIRPPPAPQCTRPRGIGAKTSRMMLDELRARQPSEHRRG